MVAQHFDPWAVLKTQAGTSTPANPAKLLITERAGGAAISGLAGLAPSACPHREIAESNTDDGEFVAAACRWLSTVDTVDELWRAIDAWVPRRERVRRSDVVADRRISEAAHAAFARLTGQTLEGALG